jgi:hypothetical protein
MCIIVTVHSFCTEIVEILSSTKKRECSAYSDQSEKDGTDLCPNTWSSYRPLNSLWKEKRKNEQKENIA